MFSILNAGQRLSRTPSALPGEPTLKDNKATVERTSEEALDGAIASGSTSGMPEALEQLDELVATLGASEGRS